MVRRNIWLAFCLLIAATTAFAAKPADIDSHSEAATREPRALSAAERNLVKPGMRIQYEERLGVPTFLWAAPSSAAERKARAVRVSGVARVDAAAEARRHAAAYASLYGLQTGDIASARVAEVHDTGTGAIIVKFKEDVGGVEVFREGLSVMMDRNFEPIALSGYLSGAPRQLAAGAASFRLDELAAAAIALSDRTGGTMTRAELVTTGARQGPYGFVDHGVRTMRAVEATQGNSASPLTEPVRFKQVYFHTADGFEPAYYLEVSAEFRDAEGNVDNDMYSYVVSARNGRILYRHDLTVSDNFTYRLWADESGSSVDIPKDSPHGNGTTPHPTGSPNGLTPPYIASSLHTLQAYPFSHSATDPWLPAAATETVGNNVDAYVDRAGGDGFTPPGDFRAPLSSPGTFDYTYDPNVDPLANLTQQRAAITSLFYIDNFLHDFFYDAGFNEAAGTAQTDNYGRGGVPGDNMRGEAQDGSGTNNANMSTPADGGRPRQQMFLWSGPQNETITVISQPVGGTLPPSYGPFQIGTSASFGAQAFDVTADVLRTIPADGCSAAISNDLTGKIAFVDRGGVGGTCGGGFVQKALNAQNAGAVGIIIANVASSGNPGVAPGMGGVNAAVTIGALSLNFADGEAWRSTLAAGTVNANMKRDTVVGRDGSLDAHVVSHEWGHYLSNRLINDASGLGNQQGGGMGEGWSDFVALLTTVREGDDVGSNVNWNGAYPLVPYAAVAFSTDGYYFGIRRIPYSTNLSIDPLTFRHISNGQFIVPPFGGPCDGCTDASNQAEVHNTGEIWSTMLWECFASLLNNHPFQDARTRMTSYLVASLKMTPTNPTFTEARDAVLAAVFAADPADAALFCAAFAKRGIGQHAVAPDRFSATNAGVVESFVCDDDLVFVSASLSSPTNSCDGDAYLDNFETASLTVTLKNTGLGTLTQTTATVTSSNPSIQFANGGVMTFPPSTPFQTTTASLDVSMLGAVGIQDFSLDISFTDPAISFPPGTASLLVRGNADDLLNASASDNVEANATAWTLGGFGGSWQRVRDTITPNPTNFVWNGPDPNNTADLYLISPTLNVAPTGNFTFTFKHRFMFENATTFFDGGVVEISTDGGATWADVNTGGIHLSPNYNHTLVSGGTNPLAGRQAYSGNSAGYPAFATVTCNLGTAFAGMAVKIRFRIGADENTGPVGWDIDDIAFNNITNTPFTLIVPQPAHDLSALSDAKVWIGLKNSDDVGTKFDLMAEVLVNGVVVGTGETDNVPGGSSGFNNAVQRTIALALTAPGTNGVCSGNTLAIRLSVRIAVGVSGHRSGTARLWFNDAQANSRFGVTVAGATTDLYLRDGFVLGTTAGPGPKKTIDVFVDRLVGGNPFKPFGTWSKPF
jgi:hypothetical protein